MKKIEVSSLQDQYFITAQDVERDGMEYDISFDKSMLNSLLKTYDLLLFNRLNAQLLITPFQKTGLNITGEITSDYAQKCVVSLAPIEQSQKITIDQKFLSAQKPQPGQEIEVDISEETPYEMENNQIDLVSFVLEIFALELDLYPRSINAVIEEKYQPISSETEDKKPSPFAVLKKLKGPN